MRIGELVERFGGKLDGDGSVEVADVKGVEFAGPAEATFALDDKLLEKAEASPACCVIVRTDARASSKPLIRCSSPESYAADLLEFFHPAPQPTPGIHPTAIIGEGALVAESATIGPNVTVGADCRIGQRVYLMASVAVGDDCEIGEATVIHPNVTVYRGSRIGSRVLIHGGAVIGADGFGFFVEGDRLRKWPHVGNVVVEDEVEIGANACVDRGKYGSTLIQAGAKIDNLVQIAHNCRVGRGAVLAGQVGLAGSVVLEDRVICGVLVLAIGVYILATVGKTFRFTWPKVVGLGLLAAFNKGISGGGYGPLVCGGQVGIRDHVTVGRGAQLAAQTGVIADIPAGSVEVGFPAKPRYRALAELAVLGYLTDNRSVLKKLVRQAAPK